jgi:hypothetical protein
MSVFSFKKEKPSESKAPGTEWEFQQVNNPDQYDQVARRGKNEFIQRNIGSGYASHWRIDHHQHQQQPQHHHRRQESRQRINQSPILVQPQQQQQQQQQQVQRQYHHQQHQIQLQPSVTMSVSSTQNHHTSNEQIYVEMFQLLVGKLEFDNIERQFQFRNSTIKKPRARITISELIHP